jgi:hypothetical protein
MERLTPRGTGPARGAGEVQPDERQVEPISRTDAFALAGSNLSGFGESRSGLVRHLERISNEATFPYQLWVREFETG